MQSLRRTSKDCHAGLIRCRRAGFSHDGIQRPLLRGKRLLPDQCAPTPLSPIDFGFITGDAKVKVTDGEMPFYSPVQPMQRTRPWCLLRWRIFGLHEYIKDVTRRLAKLGAFALAPDYYFRTGRGSHQNSSEPPNRVPLVNKKPDAELFSDLDATVSWAKSQGGDTSRLAIIGFCRGGRTVWEYAAHNSGLKAGVAFYGSLVDPDTQKSVWPRRTRSSVRRN